METYKHKLIMIKEQTYEYNQTMNGTSDAINFIRNIIKLQEEPEEILVAIGLNSKNDIIGFTEVARGCINTLNTTGRELFKRVLAMNCERIIIAHNHPSGNPEPSKADKDFTNKMYEVATYLGIQLLEHIIIGDNKEYSIRGGELNG